MSDNARANTYLAIGLGSLTGITTDIVFYPQWWILIPLFTMLVVDIIWGIVETA